MQLFTQSVHSSDKCIHKLMVTDCPMNCKKALNEFEDDDEFLKEVLNVSLRHSSDRYLLIS